MADRFERDRELPRIDALLPRIDALLIIAHGMLDIGCIEQPEANTHQIEHLEDGERLFRCPVIG